MAEVETYENVVDTTALARKWPDGRDCPKLIIDVANHVAKQQWMSLGSGRMGGDRMDDFWIENGADLWRDFGIFINLADGSRVAQWFRDGESGEPPIVLIGSEGEQEVLAPNLEAFFAAWALGKFNDKGALTVGDKPVGLPSDLIRGEDDDVPDGRPAFAKFLKRALGRDPIDVIAAKPDDAPFKAFFDTWGETARADISSNENLRAIAKIMDADIPRGKEVWEREMYSIAAVADRIEIGSKGDPRKSLDDTRAAAIQPLIQAERERRAWGVHAPRGLWHSARLLLHTDGTCQIAADWENEPSFGEGKRISADELAADFKRFPRSPRWKEAWME
jgi:hypothetical protein